MTLSGQRKGDTSTKGFNEIIRVLGKEDTLFSKSTPLKILNTVNPLHYINPCNINKHTITSHSCTDF